MTAGVSFFVNADAGDINPIVSYYCQQKPDFLGARIMSDNVRLHSSLNWCVTLAVQIANWRKALKPSTDLKLKVASKVQYTCAHLSTQLCARDNRHRCSSLATPT